MAAVFLSYASYDRALAGQIVRGLKAAGVEAWWDEDMPGIDSAKALERQIGELGAIVVLWTPAAKEDPSIKDAARAALAAGKLINACASGASPPFPYGSAAGISLDGWTGAPDHAGWTKLVELVKARAGATPNEKVETAPDQSGALNAMPSGPTQPPAGQAVQTPGGVAAGVPISGDAKTPEQSHPPAPRYWRVASRVVAVVLVCAAAVIVLAVISSMPSAPSAKLTGAGGTALFSAYIMSALAYNLWKVK